MTPPKTRPHKPLLAEWTSEILSLYHLIHHGPEPRLCRPLWAEIFAHIMLRIWYLKLAFQMMQQTKQGFWPVTVWDLRAGHPIQLHMSKSGHGLCMCPQ